MKKRDMTKLALVQAGEATAQRAAPGASALLAPRAPADRARLERMFNAHNAVVWTAGKEEHRWLLWFSKGPRP